jgi:DNA-binding transcriptional LysR family regulator
MLDDLNELRTFRAILAERSLSAAARRLGVTLAVVSKRLSTLEGRAGVRLVHRSTRSLSPTEEGARLLTDVVHALEAIDAAEGRLAGGRDEPAGTLRVSAPIAFGRRCVAPVLGQLAASYPRLAIALELDDRLVDLVGEGLDVAIRIGALADSSAIMRRLPRTAASWWQHPLISIAPAGQQSLMKRRPTHSCAMEQPSSPGAFVDRTARPQTCQRPHDCASMTAMSSTTGRWPASASC